MDEESVVPIEYLYTPHICRWRFVLSGEVKSDKNCGEVVDQAEKKGKYILLTKINRHLCLLSKVIVDKRSKTMNIAIQDKIYDINLSDSPYWMGRKNRDGCRTPCACGWKFKRCHRGERKISSEVQGAPE